MPSEPAPLLQDHTQPSTTVNAVRRTTSLLEYPKRQSAVARRIPSKGSSSVSSKENRAEWRRSLSSPTQKAQTISSSKSIGSSITNLSKDGLIHLVPGVESTFHLFLWDKDIRSQKLDITLVDARFSPEIQRLDAKHSVKIKQTRSDTFDLFLSVDKELKCSLIVTYNGLAVQGSPYRVQVQQPLVKVEAIRQSLFANCNSLPSSLRYSPVAGFRPMAESKQQSNGFPVVDEEDFLLRCFGTYGRDAGHFLNPQGICAIEPDRVAVTDSSIGCIQIFDRSGNAITRIGERGRKPGQILRPTGIAFLPASKSKHETDALVVADYENRFIVTFSLEGNVLSCFGSQKLTGPKGIAVGKNGDILVVDNRSNTILVFRNEKLFKKIWYPSTKAAKLAGPHYISVHEETGEIFVSDFHHHCIKVFDAEYNYLRSFGGFNAMGGMGAFSGPTGIAVDQRGILVADWGTGHIQLFDFSGSFIAYVTNLDFSLYGPQGMCVAADGTIFAADSGNHTIRVYRHPLT